MFPVNCQNKYFVNKHNKCNILLKMASDHHTNSPNYATVSKYQDEIPEERKLRAKKRWKFLINVLNNKKTNILEGISVRRFASFGLLKTKKLEYDLEMMVNSLTGREIERHHYWYQYTCPTYTHYLAYIRHLDGILDVTDIMGFNNTGNVCVWPSEEILTNYCLQNVSSFRGKSVCELGGGMTSLAGIAVGGCTDATDVLLTDGNQASVDNISQIIERNKESFKDTKVSARLLRWDECPEDLWDKYDIILCADCMFFDDNRPDLINVIDKLLKPLGEVIMFAPNRGKTFQLFQTLVEDKYLDVVHKENYDDQIWELHQQNLSSDRDGYDPDLHYPRMLTFRKPDQLNPPHAN